MRRIFHLGCAPSPGVEIVTNRDAAALTVASAFAEQYPNSFVVMTFMGHIGRAWTYLVTVRDDEGKRNARDAR